MIFIKNYFVDTTEDIDVTSIIHEVNRTIREANATEGFATVIVPAGGAGITIIEPLPDVVEQLKEALRIFPGEGLETQNLKKEDLVILPRVQAAMLGKSVQIPLSAGKLVLSPREEVVLVDLERDGRRREFYVQIFSETAQPGPARAAAPRRR